MALKPTLKVFHRQLYYEGAKLALAREELGMSQEDFAFQCGWSQSEQSRLELPGLIHELTYKRRKAFEDNGINIITS